MELHKPDAHNIFFFSPANSHPQTESRIDMIRMEVYKELSELAFDDHRLEMDEYDYYSEESPDPNPLIEDVLRASSTVL